MQIPIGGWKPRKYPLPDKSQIVGGWLLHTYQSDENYFLRAPSLSNFAVARRTGHRLEEYFNIRVGEVLDSEFQPPRGAPIEKRSEPGGIRVFNSR